ncbi:putative RNA-directed DNA polymerase from transposon X-element [Trichonephila clavipes]|nr:putative RNA-directed DNA polymerase from transposon X-element [Trichonephila clavipes]
MAEAAKAKQNPPDQPKRPPPAHTEESSSSPQLKDQPSPKFVSPQTREPSSSTREMSSSLPKDPSAQATPQDSPTLMDTFSQINDPEILTFPPPTCNRSIKIVTWNADGIRTKIPEFEEFIQRFDPDIIALQETFLQPCHSFNIPNYTIYRNDRLTHRGGGTAILIKSSIAHHSIHIHTHTLENTTIVLEGSNKITISCIYRPPNSPHQALIPDLLKILRNRTHCFIVGDYNAKHHSWSPHSNNNPCGSALFKFLKNEVDSRQWGD